MHDPSCNHMSPNNPLFAEAEADADNHVSLTFDLPVAVTEGKRKEFHDGQHEMSGSIKGA